MKYHLSAEIAKAKLIDAFPAATTHQAQAQHTLANVYGRPCIIGQECIQIRLSGCIFGPECLLHYDFTMYDCCYELTHNHVQLCVSL